MSVKSIKLQKYTGKEISALQKQLAELRIRVFRDFPYLYEGSFEYEAKYLDRYIRTPNAAIIAIFDESTNQLVGAASVLPLRDEESYIQEPFIKGDYNPDEIYYFGESLLLPEYRGQGIGHRFFDERESHAKFDLKCKITSFCAVDRPTKHPMRPENYRPLDEFWQARGYKKDLSLKANFSWQDIGDKEETKKSMTFWWREI